MVLDLQKDTHKHPFITLWPLVIFVAFKCVGIVFFVFITNISVSKLSINIQFVSFTQTLTAMHRSYWIGLREAIRSFLPISKTCWNLLSTISRTKKKFWTTVSEMVFISYLFIYRIEIYSAHDVQRCWCSNNVVLTSKQRSNQCCINVQITLY